MEREKQLNSQRTYGIVRDLNGPTIDALGSILADHMPAIPREIRVHPDTIRELFAIAKPDEFIPALKLEGIIVVTDGRLPLETAVVVYPGKDRIPKLVFWVWGEAAKRKAAR